MRYNNRSNYFLVQPVTHDYYNVIEGEHGKPQKVV